MDQNIHLGEFQRLLVVLILDLGEEASVAAIHREMEKRMSGTIPVEAMLPCMEQMEEKGLIRSHADENVPERDGSQDRFFRVTAAGHEAFDRSVEYMRKIERGEIPRPPFII
jgi:DNA-binding PadR family transcriptional regulator